MKRSTLILGFALLIVAATLAITITFRNDPRLLATAQGAAEESAGHPAPLGEPAGNTANRSAQARSETRPAAVRDRFEVTIPVEALAERPPAEQAEFHRRADAIQRKARRQLDRMTGEFELSSTQRARLFPLLVRSTPGYDPVMQVGGAPLVADPLTPAGEEIHELLDPDQQVLLEDEELDRQLWWQDLFARIETELIDSTGGLPTQARSEDPGAATAEPVDPGPERTAPNSRGGRD